MIPADILLGICCRYSGSDYFVGDLIPHDKLANFRKELPSFSLPDGEAVVALLDCTVFGSNKHGIALCTNGVYWNSDHCVPRRGFLPWEEVVQRTIHANGMNDIALGQTVRLSLSGCAFPRDDLSFILAEAQTYLLRARPSKAGLPRGATAPPIPMPEHATWLLAVSGEQFGPYDAKTIKSLVKAHRVDPAECLAWRPGLDRWVPLPEVPELQDESAPITSAAPPARVTMAPLSDAPIDLNNAPLDALLLLPGINLVLARELVAERQRRRGFSRLDDVGHFLQLQPHEVERLKQRVTLGEFDAAASALLDLNRADEEQIARLPGIGPVLAKRAVELRSRQGGFASVAELTDALNLSPRMAERVQQMACVTPPDERTVVTPARRVVDY